MTQTVSGVNNGCNVKELRMFCNLRTEEDSEVRRVRETLEPERPDIPGRKTMSKRLTRTKPSESTHPEKGETSEKVMLEYIRVSKLI